MAEAQLVPNTVTADKAISAREAAKRFGAQRQVQGTNNPVSDAARTLGQRAAEARKLRQPEAPQPQEAETVEVEAEQQQSDTAENATATEAADQSHLQESEQVTETQEEAASSVVDDQTEYDLGEGQKLTVKEIRENLLRQADYTRKTTELADTRKAFESDRTQRLTLLDNVIVAGQQLLGQPKNPQALIEELGMEEGMKAYFNQVQQFETLGKVIQARQQEQAQHMDGLKQSTIKELGAKHGEKAAETFSKAVTYVASKTGADPKAVEAMLSHPEAVELVLDGMKFRDIETNRPKVTKMVAGKPAVIKPGAKVSAQATAQNRIQKAEATLKHSGKLADAVALLRAKRGTRAG